MPTPKCFINCKTCGKQVPSKPYRTDHFYCSMNCRHSKVEHICQECGIKFLVHSYRDKQGTGNFCSQSCLGKHNCRERYKDRLPLIERFWSKVNKTDTCWLWTGGKNGAGYGLIILDNSKEGSMLAHRLSWEIHNEPISDGLCALHKCDNPSCVNPYHLFLGTHQDNSDDKVAKGRSPRGETHHHSSLTEDKVREIRRLANEGKTHQSIADMFSVKREAVSKIVRRERWKHVL
jgi:HNH endonuclease